MQIAQRSENSKRRAFHGKYRIEFDHCALTASPTNAGGGSLNCHGALGKIHSI
jgi:hypothetical protein